MFQVFFLGDGHFSELIIPLQQHGSVYWSTSAELLLSSLDSERTLAEQLIPGAYSYLKAPIWQDSSTTEDCKLLEEKFGGPQAVADRSGSRAYERFTGNQISRVRVLVSHLLVSQ